MQVGKGRQVKNSRYTCLMQVEYSFTVSQGEEPTLMILPPSVRGGEEG